MITKATSLYKEHYDKKVAPALMKQLHIKNVMACPKVNKVYLNIGLGKVAKEAAAFETAENTLKRITGQKPVVTKARKAISNFKIRAGLPIGLTVVLRGRRAEEFLWKLIHIALPRVRDFHGLSPKSVDRTGNMAIGFKEHLVFPEIKSDEVERLHGLEVIIKTSARTQERGLALFKALGFPFQKSN